MQVYPCKVIREAENACFMKGCTTSAALMDYVIDRMREAVERMPELAGRRITRVSVYAGKGNNAGDALGLAARFPCSIQVNTVCAPPQFSAETAQQFAKLKHRQVAGAVPEQASGEGCTLIIDGILGSGARGPLSPEYRKLVKELNRERDNTPDSLVLSVDIPTGLQADTGELPGEVVKADVTVAIGCVKPGMLADGAEDYVGRLLCIPLPQVELPQTARQHVAEPSLFAALPRRAYSCFKNRAGRVHIVAGSVGYVGAAQLCAEAAVAAGAGLVALYCPEAVYPILAARVAPEVMVHPVRSYAEVPVTGAQALVVGPGIGAPDAAEAAALYRLVQGFNGPVVLDADGLNTAARCAWRIPPHCILTPHAGEMRRLFPQAAELSRAETVRQFLQIIPCTLLYKGARSIISDGVQTFYNSTGGPYMANGGQGDVLSGVIAALAAQGCSPVHAAALGAYACGLAGAIAAAHAGYARAVSASQLIKGLPRALSGTAV